MSFTILIPFLLLSYLIGSLNPAILISNLFFGEDVRKKGSGNAGSTNMFRNYGFVAGISTQLFDIVKSAICALFPWVFIQLSDQPAFDWTLSAMFCGLACVVGHIWPVYYRFKGGKGVNSLLGMMLVVNPLACLISVAVFALVLLLTRYVSLGSVLATLAFPVFIGIKTQMSEIPLILSGLGMFLLVVFTHRENIGRLVKGVENKVGKQV